jgi:hypothetical protein
MPKRKIAKLTLRVRAADDPNWTEDSRRDAADFDHGWAARQHSDNTSMLPALASRGYLAGWLAADTAWNARHQVTSGIWR